MNKKQQEAHDLDNIEWLKSVRKYLKDIAATRARLEWSTKLANKDALAARVLTQEVINHGDEYLLRQISKYFNVNLDKEVPRFLPFEHIVGNSKYDVYINDQGHTIEVKQ